jgi:uncharacterized protein (TIGR03083 family)
MPDDAELRDLDPFDVMDQEAARLDAFFAALDEDDAAWQAPSVCQGWSVHDVLSHLAAGEIYNHACLDDNIGPVFDEYGARGVTDVDSFNAIGVADRVDKSHAEVLEEWRTACGRTRRELRGRSGGDIPTMVGPYPANWQAWHLASELATHADDIGVPVDPAEQASRTDWRARFSRFVIEETKPDVQVGKSQNGTTVTVGGRELTLDDNTLVAAAAGRLPPGTLDEDARAALSTVS